VELGAPQGVRLGSRGPARGRAGAWRARRGARQDFSAQIVRPHVPALRAPRHGPQGKPAGPASACPLQLHLLLLLLLLNSHERCYSHSTPLLLLPPPRRLHSLAQQRGETAHVTDRGGPGRTRRTGTSRHGLRPRPRVWRSRAWRRSRKSRPRRARWRRGSRRRPRWRRRAGRRRMARCCTRRCRCTARPVEIGRSRPSTFRALSPNGRPATSSQPRQAARLRGPTSRPPRGGGGIQ
jgi:hypothetical protein